MSGARDTRLIAGLAIGIALALALAVTFGETAFSAAQYGAGVTRWSSDEALVLWQIRAPRAVCALGVGAALGLAGAVLQGLLRNPLADRLMAGLASIGDVHVLGPAVALTLAWLIWRRRWLGAAHWLAALAFGMALTALLGKTLL